MNIYKTSLLSCYLSKHYLVVLGFHPIWMYWNSVLTLTTQNCLAISFTCRSHIPLSLYVSCCCSVAKSCLTLYGPMVCSTLGFPVLYYFLEFTQTHVQWVSDAIQPSHPLSPPSPPVLSPSQHQSLLFQWVDSLYKVAKVLERQIQHESFQWISSVQSLSHVQLFVTLWTAGCQASPSITNSQSLLKLMSSESVMPSNHLILCHPLLLLLPSVFASIGVL